jgi:E3 SUMO-protein ligase RanBP2
VKLEEVEVKTGEEDEDVLFKARCKLYRFIAETKEWKEKGAGEIKVLKRKETTNVFRILMRRDQIFKLCANHRITSDIKLEIANEKQVRWHAQDYSEPGEGKHELLTAKFRHEDEAKQFKAEVEKAQVILASEPSIPQTDTNKATTATTSAATSSGAGSKPSLSEMFKKDKQWTCNACYVSNGDNLLKCLACQAVRTDGKTPTGSLPKSESEDSGID